MTSVPPEYLIAMQATLRQLLEDAGAFIARYNSAPTTGSHADLERGEHTELIGAACSIGSMLVHVSADHVSLFSKSLTPPVEVAGAMTCVRSMLEGSAIGAWLLDPDADAFTRAGRCLAHRLSWLSQQKTLAREFGQDGDLLKAERQIDRLEARALSAGFSRVYDRKGKPSVGPRMPSATAIIGEVLADAESYRLLSGVAHAQSGMILQLLFAQSGGFNEHGGVEVAEFERSDDFRGVALAGLCAFNAFCRIVWNQCLYFGWDALKLEEIIETAADHIAYSEERRFWRS